MRVALPLTGGSGTGSIHCPSIDRMLGQTLFAHITPEKGERNKPPELASNLL